MTSFEDYLRAEFMEEYQSNDKDAFEEAFIAWLGSFQIDDWFRYEKEYQKNERSLPIRNR